MEHNLQDYYAVIIHPYANQLNSIGQKQTYWTGQFGLLVPQGSIIGLVLSVTCT